MWKHFDEISNRYDDEVMVTMTKHTNTAIKQWARGMHGENMQQADLSIVTPKAFGLLKMAMDQVEGYVWTGPDYRSYLLITKSDELEGKPYTWSNITVRAQKGRITGALWDFVRKLLEDQGRPDLTS
jgi:hypothetical protein